MNNDYRWPDPQQPGFQQPGFQQPGFPSQSLGTDPPRSLLANIMPWLCFCLVGATLFCEWLSFFASSFAGKPISEGWANGGQFGMVTMSGAAICALVAIVVARWPAAVHLGWFGILFGMLAVLFGLLMIRHFALQQGIEIPVPVGLIARL